MLRARKKHIKITLIRKDEVIIEKGGEAMDDFDTIGV